MSDASVVCSNLSFSWPDGTRVFESLSFVFDGGRTGLVAPNGAGKTTLLELIAGRYRPDAGGVSVRGAMGYLPQRLPYTPDLTVAEVSVWLPFWRRWTRWNAGDARDEVFAAIGDDWDIAERVTAELDRLALGPIDLDRRLDSLSGGEIVALGLAAQLLRRPDVLLLDEPTNNLDLHGRTRLYSVLDGYAGCLVVASHDRQLLRRMDRIAELTLQRNPLLRRQLHILRASPAARAGHRRTESAQRRSRPQTPEARQAEGQGTCRPPDRHRGAEPAAPGSAQSAAGQARE